jgi:DNA polymerase III subunit chi
LADILFYHLERQKLEQVLPQLLEKSLERGWRCVVQAGSAERVEALDAMLWTYGDEGFLPHGAARDGFEAAQPVFLTDRDDNPNAATVRFLVDGAGMDAFEGYERIVHLFDGRDDRAVAAARSQWKVAAAAGHQVTYWQQDDAGRWVKKA